MSENAQAGLKLPTGEVDFSTALYLLRRGERVVRSGWNGKGMFVVLQKGYPDGVPINKNTADATGIPEGTIKKFRPYLMLYTAQGDFCPWAPSASDVLAEDWGVAGLPVEAING